MSPKIQKGKQNSGLTGDIPGGSEGGPRGQDGVPGAQEVTLGPPSGFYSPRQGPWPPSLSAPEGSPCASGSGVPGFHPSSAGSGCVASDREANLSEPRCAGTRFPGQLGSTWLTGDPPPGQAQRTLYGPNKQSVSVLRGPSACTRGQGELPARPPLPVTGPAPTLTDRGESDVTAEAASAPLSWS